MAQFLDWSAVEDQEPAHVVITKGNRVQVLVSPTPKQLRQRAKRNWSLVAATGAGKGGGGNGTLPRELREAILGAVRKLARGGRARKNKTGRAARAGQTAGKGG
jgi:hypothetical protein